MDHITGNFQFFIISYYLYGWKWTNISISTNIIFYKNLSLSPAKLLLVTFHCLTTGLHFMSMWGWVKPSLRVCYFQFNSDFLFKISERHKLLKELTSEHGKYYHSTYVKSVGNIGNNNLYFKITAKVWLVQWVSLPFNRTSARLKGNQS